MPSPREIDDDQVKRRHVFQEANPAWHFISPYEPRSLIIGETSWRIIAPDGEVIRDPELGGAIDQAEAKIEAAGGDPVTAGLWDVPASVPDPGAGLRDLLRDL